MHLEHHPTKRQFWSLFFKTVFFGLLDDLLSWHLDVIGILPFLRLAWELAFLLDDPKGPPQVITVDGFRFQRVSTNHEAWSQPQGFVSQPHSSAQTVDSARLQAGMAGEQEPLGTQAFDPFRFFRSNAWKPPVAMDGRMSMEFC